MGELLREHWRRNSPLVSLLEVNSPRWAFQQLSDKIIGIFNLIIFMVFQLTLSPHAVFFDALHELVPFIQFKNHEKHPWRGFTFKSKTPPCGVFHVFKLVQNCAKHHIFSSIAIFYYIQEFGSRFMSIEKKSLWTVGIINECYVYCFSLR